MAVYMLGMSYLLNILCHLCLLPYDYQFLMHFLPTLDDLHSKFLEGGVGGGGPHPYA